MVTLQFILGRDTRTPISVIIQDESAAVAMDHFEKVFDKWVAMADDPDGEDEPSGGETPPGIGTGGSFDIN